jgi:arginyl-tRNA synthetase
MNTIELLKKSIVDSINQALGKDLVQVSDLVYPPDSKMGDLSLPCFNLAREMKKSPAQVAQELVSSIEANDFISGTKTAGAYFNIALKTSNLAKAMAEEIRQKKSAYGCNDYGAKKKIMIEYSNANTHKEYHVGHLRNICYGDALNRIISANGFESIPVSYINDFGIHVAKTLWALQTFYKEADLPENKGQFLGSVYVRASSESKDNDAAKRLIEMTMKQVETRQGEAYELWKKTRQWSIEQFDGIYKELGVNFVHIFYESEYIDEGLKIVEELKVKNILSESRGAIIADLEEYGLGVQVIIRSDGTALYAVADLALASAKAKMFGPDVSIYLTDIRQSLHFKQLFKILELAGFKEELVHLGYEFVKLPSGMMSSRSGNVVTYEDLKSECMAKAESETRARHADWTEEKVRKVARAITNGAIKFEMIKVSSKQEIVFDTAKALAFSGFTAAYLQYTYARINSVIKKSGVDIDKLEIDFNNLSEQKEHDLALFAARYSESVKYAGEKYDPAEIAKYLFDLAQQFNDYYHAISVLKADDEIKNVRLVLLGAVGQIIKNGLNLLGIDVVKEM